MLISLIVCTYKRPVQIESLMTCLIDQTVKPDEILIVDGSEDELTQTMLEKKQSDILPFRYIRVDPALRGLTRQRNVGIGMAKGEVIAFLDDDTIPDERYFEEIQNCFYRHPDAVGVGGLITNETSWIKIAELEKKSYSFYYWNNWKRRDDYRWRLRKVLGLDSPLPPGWMPPFGHGRSANYPPDGLDYPVEFIMGGASAWRSAIFRKCQFSSYFTGYGLYEDLEFSIRASQQGHLYLCTRAQLAHFHASGGRPNLFAYGKMVVRNGWYVWRKRWPTPSFLNKSKWWFITCLLCFFRLMDFRKFAIDEAVGRFFGMVSLFFNRPGDNRNP